MPTSNETAVAYANHELHGKDAVLHFVDGAREQGTIEYVQPQATAWWIRSDSLRIAPTSEIERIVFDNRAKTTLTGLAIGAGAGLLVALGASTLGGDADSAGEAFALGLGQAFLIYAAPPVFTLYGTGFGALLGRMRVYSFTD
ncbi:MAG: hypothetical protein AAGF99_01560 [Bacteroidota bacterium]